MKTSIGINMYDNRNDQYPQFSEAINDRFSSFTDKPLFTTNVEDLFSTFLDNLPREARQHYTCNCCKHFVNRFGGLVHITEKGEIVSVMWDEQTTPKFFANAVKAMKNILHNSRVTGVFISSEVSLGQSHSNGWDHMHVTLPANKVYRDRLKTAEQEMAVKREDYRTLISGLVEYPLDSIEKALTMLQSESLYRGDRFVGMAQWVKNLHDKREEAKNSRVRDNLTWLAVAVAPTGFTHFGTSSSMIGTLLDDIVSGYDTDSIVRRFADKMGTYQRSQTPPSEGNKQQAEKIVAQLGIENSLKRRYATIEEIPHFIWQSKKVVKNTAAKMGGVFGHIATKEKSSTPDELLNLTYKVMTWDKFSRTVLPTATNLEVLIDNPNRLMALVTASDKEAPNILQWEDNTFSWYYHGGIDGEIKRRVESAGGQYENNEIRCSLIWEGETDLDLHCITPNRSHIYYSDKRADDRGFLDIDANGLDGITSTPVENMRWSKGLAQEGQYRFYVHNYTERGTGITPFTVELDVNGHIYTSSGALRDGQKVTVFEFNYVKGKAPNITNASSASKDAWNIPTNSFVKVKAVTNSPNLWGEKKVEHSGHHIFFLLDGCKDMSEGKGRGFFTETLKPELREIRKTLEAYTAATPIEGVEQATACGVGYSKDSEWGLLVKVASDNSTRVIKIDRWD
ncbi:hypothetical protein M5X17_27860 [Paenibacillus alvei]|uniref:hypothetical protein n=1 Tax=Paenibacillus alvei TaxID=44250 RepID=UPI002281B6BF|nr:hypothetical protein [Paenibacillus alvei]MCY9737523.1 hypothetical protein [Paenibacillus alvei]